MMTPGDICREYRLAKDQKKQIRILADINSTTTDEIIKVLVDCGEMESPKKTEKKRMAIPEGVVNILSRRLDELEGQIKPLEDQLKPLEKEFKEIAAFLGSCGQ